MEKELVSEKRGYLLRTVAEAKEIVLNWVREINLVNAIKLGLPEVDDRYHIWRVPLCNEQKKTVLLNISYREDIRSTIRRHAIFSFYTFFIFLNYCYWMCEHIQVPFSHDCS